MDKYINADINLSPERSHIVVLGLTILCGISFFIGSGFLWYEKQGYWIPFVFSLMFFFSAIFTWYVSHKNLDLQGATPTRITSGSKGTELVTDARTLESPESVKVLQELLNVVAFRKPLPMPDGMVSSDGKPDARRLDEAHKMVSDINEAVAESTSHIAELFIGSNAIGKGYIAQPLDLEPECSDAMSKNLTQEQYKA